MPKKDDKDGADVPQNDPLAIVALKIIAATLGNKKDGDKDD